MKNVGMHPVFAAGNIEIGLMRNLKDLFKVFLRVELNIDCN